MAEKYIKLWLCIRKKYLAVYDNNENGTNCVQWDYLDKPNHQFYFEYAGNNSWFIVPLHSHKPLAVHYNLDNNTNCVQWDKLVKDNHLFYFEKD